MSRPRRTGGSVRYGIAVLLLFGSFALALGWLAKPLSGLLTHQVVNTAKPILAAAAALLLATDRVLQPRGLANRHRRLRDGMLIAIAGCSALAWWNFMQFHYPRHTHFSDTYHYYVGAKYFQELRYTRLYACTAVADREAGPQTRVDDRTLRNLETNALESTRAALAHPEACKRHFSARRWAAFRHDVGWFRSRVARSRWNVIQRDHGYNAPPSWAILGATLANLGPASERQIFWLGLLDPMLLALMWACVAWAFGWRTLSIAVVFWGTNLFAVFGWTGGSFLRQGWLVTSIAGICCLRKGRPMAAGALLTSSALLRIFPAALLAAGALRALASSWRRGRFHFDREERRVALGGLLAAAAILPLSAAAVGGMGAWVEFIHNSRVHLATPLKNHVGLATLLAYDPATVDRLVTGSDAIERYQTWSDARHVRFSEHVWMYRGIVFAFLLLLTFAVRDQPLWVAAILGVGLIPIAFELTNYYYAILLGYALLSESKLEVGAALCGISALSWGIVELWHWQDEIMVWCSAMVVVFVIACTLRFLDRPADPTFQRDRRGQA
jgi:hypothetical protein